LSIVGINVGVFYAISTLLSQMILVYHPDAQEESGTTGLLIVVSGMFGSVVCGYILDKWHHFKLAKLRGIIYFFIQGHHIGRLFVLLCWNGTVHGIVGLILNLAHFHSCHHSWVRIIWPKHLFHFQFLHDRLFALGLRICRRIDFPNCRRYNFRPSEWIGPNIRHWNDIWDGKGGQPVYIKL
jgi:hypothetical protein